MECDDTLWRVFGSGHEDECGDFHYTDFDTIRDRYEVIGVKVHVTVVYGKSYNFFMD